MIKTIFIIFNIILLNGWDEKGKIKLGGKDKFKLGGQWEGGGREKAKSNFIIRIFFFKLIVFNYNVLFLILMFI